MAEASDFNSSALDLLDALCSLATAAKPLISPRVSSCDIRDGDRDKTGHPPDVRGASIYIIEMVEQGNTLFTFSYLDNHSRL